MATPNFNWTEVSASQNQKEVTINDVFNKIEDAISASFTAAITVSNTFTLTSAEFREAFFITCTDGGLTAASTVFVPAIAHGAFAVVNNSGQTVTVSISGQSEPAVSVNDGEMKIMTSGGSNVRVPVAGVANFLGLTDTPSSFAGQAGLAAVVNSGETALEFATVASGSGAGAVAVNPEHKGAQLKLSGNLTVTTNTLTTVPWGATQYDTEFQPDTGLAQRFWLGADQTFVDGDVTTGTDEVAVAAHGFSTGEGPFELTSSGTLPAGLALATEYWVISVSAGVLKFATSRANAIAGTAVDITAAAGGGTHTIETATRLVVPNGVTKVRLVAQASWEDITGTNSGTRFLNINKNGASFQGGGAEEFNAAESGGSDDKSRQVVASGVVEVVEGDYFEMEVRHRQGVDLDLTVANSTNFFIEVVETTKSTQLPTAFISVQPAHKGALVSENAAQAFTSATINPLEFDTAQYDTGFQPDDAGGTQRFWLGVDATFVDGDVSTGADTVTETAHGFTTGEGPVRLTNSGGALPTGLATATDYWVIAVDADTISFATSRALALAGTVVDITAAAGGGTHTIETETWLVIPAGVTKVRMQGNVQMQNMTGASANIQFNKNGGTAPGLGIADHNDTAGTDLFNISSGTIEVSEGDRFELSVFPDAAETLNANADTNWMAIEVVETSKAQTFPGVTVERPFIGALLALSANQTNLAATAFPGTVLSWGAETYDTGYRGTEFHSTSVNPSRITIPVGVTRVRLSSNVMWAAPTLALDKFIGIFKNGAEFPGSGQDLISHANGINRQRQGTITSVVDVVAGDYFEVFGWSDSTTNDDIDVDDETWFHLEVIETEEAAQPPLDLSFYVGGTPGAGVKIGKHTATRRFTLNDDLASSQAHADTAGTVGAAVFDVQRNGVSIGSITFAVASTTATFTTSGASEEVFAIGDRLTVVAPNPANATLADVAITLFGYRS